MSTVESARAAARFLTGATPNGGYAWGRSLEPRGHAQVTVIEAGHDAVTVPGRRVLLSRVPAGWSWWCEECQGETVGGPSFGEGRMAATDHLNIRHGRWWETRGPITAADPPREVPPAPPTLTGLEPEHERRAAASQRRLWEAALWQNGLHP